MKTDKVFVRTNFHENNTRNNKQRHRDVEKGERYRNQRDQRKNNNHGTHKKYAQKSNRDAFKQILQGFKPCPEIPEQLKQIINRLPQFFNSKIKNPQKQNSQSLNEFVIYNAKKYLQSLNFEKPKQIPMIQSSDPDWNSDEDVDCNLQSKKIDNNIVEKVIQKMGDKPIKKQDTLKKHEKQFLQDYYKNKRILQQEQKQKQQAQKLNKQLSLKQINKKQEKVIKKQQQKKQVNINIWSDYEQKQVNSLIDRGFMTKIDDNQQQQIEVVQNDDMFNEDFQEQINNITQKNQKQSQSSQQQNDIFGDDGPTTTTVKSNKTIQKNQNLGVVQINDKFFHQIAFRLGLNPAKCNWIIKDPMGKHKYRVTTEYMDTQYRKQGGISSLIPLISLFHSQFVHVKDVQTNEAFQKFKVVTYRKTNTNQQRQNQYKGKQGYNQYHHKNK